MPPERMSCQSVAVLPQAPHIYIHSPHTLHQNSGPKMDLDGEVGAACCLTVAEPKDTSGEKMLAS